MAASADTAPPQLVMLAGPNGAGKSTFYQQFLKPSRLPFLNADVIEAKTGIASIEIARILDALRADLVAQRAGFITETVFSDPAGTKVALLRDAVAAGYEVVLVYLAVEPAKRFARSLVNLRAAVAFVPLVKIYDNSSIDEPFRLVATYEHGKRTFVAPALPKWAGRALGSRRR